MNGLKHVRVARVKGPGLGASTAPDCRGAVTAEFAVALPSVVLLLALVLAGSAAGVTQIRIEEAARGGARALARGAPTAEVDAIVHRLGGEAAGSTVALDGEWRGVTVSSRVPGPVGSLIPWTLNASAWARAEASGPAQPSAPDDVSRSQRQLA
ncbi:TadE family type IV pilus minor pilin [Arthrobacter sp. NPDC058192]|uniref:TadE family type IV pilus minor pilin n=1 Tax=Arthrobacter sp. NPDC058192 TaxID=3346372 RepID=UPI0036E5A230